MVNKAKGFKLPLAFRRYEYIDKITPESVPARKIDYKPVESLKGTNIIAMATEGATLMGGSDAI